MAMILPILQDGERVVLRINLWDMVQWEDHAREYKLAINANDTGFQKMKYTSYLAYSAAKRTGVAPEGIAFGEWLKTVELITEELENDADDDDPISGPVIRSIG